MPQKKAWQLSLPSLLPCNLKWSCKSHDRGSEFCCRYLACDCVSVVDGYQVVLTVSLATHAARQLLSRSLMVFTSRKYEFHVIASFYMLKMHCRVLFISWWSTLYCTTNCRIKLRDLCPVESSWHYSDETVHYSVQIELSGLFLLF